MGVYNGYNGVSVFIGDHRSGTFHTFPFLSFSFSPCSSIPQGNFY